MHTYRAVELFHRGDYVYIVRFGALSINLFVVDLKIRIPYHVKKTTADEFFGLFKKNVVKKTTKKKPK